jgi:hypothetical protein
MLAKCGIAIIFILFLLLCDTAPSMSVRLGAAGPLTYDHRVGGGAVNLPAKMVVNSDIVFVLSSTDFACFVCLLLDLLCSVLTCRTL